MRIKSLSISLFLGLIYLFITTSILPSSTFWGQYILLLLLPIPIFLVILSFSFWYSIVAFLPIIIAMFFNLNYAANINILITIPLLIIFIFINLKLHKPGKYIPLIIIGYPILLFLNVHYYFHLHNFSLPDFILDNIYKVLFHLSSSNPDILSSNKIIHIVDILAFFTPTFIALIFFLIIISNYIIANYLINKNNSKFFNLQIGARLPSFYIYIFIIYIIGLLISHYFLNINLTTMYTLYNIASILVLPFMVSGLGVINKNNLFLFLFVILLFLFSLYTIIVICLIGFLKEVKEVKLIFNNKTS